jgi:hypothetical protein
VALPAAHSPTAPAESPGVPVKNGSTRFIEAMRDGTALNKKGKPFKPQARKTIEGALKGRVAKELGESSLNGITRGQIQTMIAEQLSGSRVHNVLNALRSLYNFAIPRDVASASPITNIVLPAVDENRATGSRPPANSCGCSPSSSPDAAQGSQSVR